MTEAPAAEEAARRGGRSGRASAPPCHPPGVRARRCPEGRRRGPGRRCGRQARLSGGREAPAEEEAAPRHTRRRATRRVSAPAGAPAAGGPPGPAGRAPPPPRPSEPRPFGRPWSPAEEEAAPRRTRRRATRRVSRPPVPRGRGDRRGRGRPDGGVRQ
ncbi:hypothetical protein LT493_21440 [Streptomyces tricolor]|nr:hypothetical protein [Streptomyces tricolor]